MGEWEYRICLHPVTGIGLRSQIESIDLFQYV